MATPVTITSNSVTTTIAPPVSPPVKYTLKLAGPASGNVGQDLVYTVALLADNLPLTNMPAQVTLKDTTTGAQSTEPIDTVTGTVEFSLSFGSAGTFSLEATAVLGG